MANNNNNNNNNSNQHKSNVTKQREQVTRHPDPTTYPSITSIQPEHHSDLIRHLEVFIPIQFLCPNAKSLRHFEYINYTNVSKQYELIIDLISTMANLTSRHHLQPKKPKKTKSVAKTIAELFKSVQHQISELKDDLHRRRDTNNSRDLNNSSDNTDVGDENGDENVDQFMKTAVQNRTDVVMTWRVVTDVSGDAVGYALRVSVTADGEKIMTNKFLQIVKLNAQKAHNAIYNGTKRKRGGHNDDSPFAYRNMTYADYESAIHCYTGETRYKVDDESCLQLGGRLNPFRIFTIQESLRLACSVGAAPKQCDIDEFYSRAIENHPNGGDAFVMKFPHNDLVYKLEVNQYTPNDMHQYFFPHLRKPATASNRERTEWTEMYYKAKRLEIDDSMYTPKELRQRLKQLRLELETQYDRNINLNEGATEPNDIDHLKERMTKRAGDIAHLRNYENDSPQSKANLERWWKKNNANKKTGIKELMTIMNVEGDTGEAVQFVDAWGKEYLKTHQNFNLPRVKQSSNLSRFGDLMHSKAVGTECISESLFTQQEIITLQAACHHVFFHTNFQLHCFLVGDAKVGKSYCTKRIQKMSIPGTYHDLSYITEKGMAGAGKRNNCSIDILEECPPSLLGVNNDHTGNKSSNTSNTDAEAFLKKRLCDGHFTFRTKVVVDGEHTTVEVEVECKSVTILCTNVDLKDVNEPVKSRFNVMQFTHKTRDDRRAINTFAGITRTEQSKAIHEAYLMRCKRDQYLSCLIGHCVAGGIFAEVNMTAADNVFRAVLAKAKERMLPNADDARHFERLIFLTKVLVMWDAIDQYFDSEFSPMIGQKWSPEMILGIEKLLVSRTEHAVMALGLLEHQWENPTSRVLIQHIKDKVLGYDAARLYDMRWETGYDGTKTPRTYFAIPLPQHQNSKHTPWYREQQFIDAIKPYMTISPSDSDLHVALRELSLHQVSVVNPHVETLSDSERAMEAIASPPRFPSIPVPGIEFTPTEVRINYTLVVNHKSDVLKTCVEDVLNYHHMNDQFVLYGRTLQGKGYIWETMDLRLKPETAYDWNILEASYHDAVVVQATQDLCDYIKTETKHILAAARARGETEAADYGFEIPKSLRTLDFDHAFSKVPFVQLDKSLDEFARIEHNANIGLNVKEALAAPINDAVKYQQLVIESHNELLANDSSFFKPLYKYPDCFTRPRYHIERANINKEVASNPSKYSVSVRQQARRYQPIQVSDATITAAAATSSDEEEDDVDDESDEDEYEDVIMEQKYDLIDQENVNPNSQHKHHHHRISAAATAPPTLTRPMNNVLQPLVRRRLLPVVKAATPRIYAQPPRSRSLIPIPPPDQLSQSDEDVVQVVDEERDEFGLFGSAPSFNGDDDCDTSLLSALFSSDSENE